MTNEQPEALRLAASLDTLLGYRGTYPDVGKAAAELRRLHELHVLYQDKVERLTTLCHDYLGELSAMRAAKQMQHRIEELKVQREWSGLTDEAIWLEYQRFWPFHSAEEPRLAEDISKFAKAIEAKLKEKNT